MKKQNENINKNHSRVSLSGMVPLFDNSRRAFTLIELLVVVLIIGILAAVALLQYTLAVDKARATEALTVLRSIKNAQEVFYLENGRYAVSGEEAALAVTIPQSGDWDYHINGGPNCSSYAAHKRKHWLLFFRFSHQAGCRMTPDSVVCGYDRDVYAADSKEAKSATRICKALGATGTGSRMNLTF